MRRSLAIAGLVLLLGACSPDKGFGETEDINADDFGSDWPLTVETATLNKVCGEGDTAVAIIVERKTYVIDFDHPSQSPTAFLPLWAEDPTAESGRKDLGPLLDRAESLCD